MKSEYLEKFIDDATVGFVGSMSKLFKSEGIPLLRGKNIKPYAIDYSDLKFIDSDTHLKWKKSSILSRKIALDYSWDNTSKDVVNVYQSLIKP